MADNRKKPDPDNAATTEDGLDIVALEALRRRRNRLLFGGIIALCVVFYLITLIRLGGA